MGKNLNGIFGTFVSERPQVNLLPVGDNDVELVRGFITHSGLNADGSVKDRSDKPYADHCPQYGIVLKGEEGVMTVRLNGMGYYRTDDFDPDELKAQGIVDGDGYAMIEKDGQHVRLQHEQRTEDCKNILNQVFAAFGIEEGSGLDALVPGLRCVVTVKEETWVDPVTNQEKPQRKVAVWKKATVPAEQGDLA